jgi:NAD(P)-dependent dehydrogenase (short-subunit alcohol dehydrogenase family)
MGLLDGRVAIVTGAGHGIGRGHALELAKEGARVLVNDLGSSLQGEGRGKDADLTVEIIRSRGGEAAANYDDVADFEAAGRMVRQAIDELGRLDILVNNAGIAHVAPALETPVEAWDRVMAINLRAPFLLAQALAPAMIAQRWGKIVNVSSQTGVIALDDHAAYATSKGGLNALTKSLMAEWARHNVQVNAICPTVVMTPMGRTVWGPEEKGGPMRAATPLRRFGEPVEIADLALYLASPAAELVNGALVMIEGGYSSV